MTRDQKCECGFLRVLTRLSDFVALVPNVFFRIYVFTVRSPVSIVRRSVQHRSYLLTSAKSDHAMFCFTAPSASKEHKKHKDSVASSAVVSDHRDKKLSANDREI